MSGALLPTIEVPLTFIASTTTRPHVLMSANHAEANRRTGDFRSLPVADARSLSEPPALDGEGFALEQHRTSVAEFYDLAAVFPLRWRSPGTHAFSLDGGANVRS